jgi:hypothetical protein
MHFRCVDCKRVVPGEEIVLLNGIKDDRVLFVCSVCINKPKPVAQTPEKKEEIKGKIATMLEVIGGSK